MERKKVRNSGIAMIAFGIVYLLELLNGTILLKPGDEMGYTILNLYIVLPLVALICSFVMGRYMSMKINWTIPIVMGALAVLLVNLVYPADDYQLISFWIMGGPSLVGVVIGNASKLIKAN